MKAKVHLELYLARDMKSNKKGFYRFVISKLKTMENTGPLLNGSGDLVLKDMETSEILSNFFISIFIEKIHLQESEGLTPEKYE